MTAGLNARQARREGRTEKEKIWDEEIGARRREELIARTNKHGRQQR